MRGGIVAFLDQLSSWRENNRLEFKRAQGGFPKSFWETYSAFANTSGGLIVLGVDETPDGPKAAGVTNADALVQDLWNGLNNPQRVSANLLIDSDVTIKDVDGTTLVAVKVPRADRTLRPVYINNSMNAGTYRRNGEGDYHCTMEVIRAMVRDSYDGALDRDVVDEVGLDALSGDSVHAYRNEFSTLRLRHPWNDFQDDEFLLRLGAIGRSQEDGKLHPTKAGLLMFGEAWRITEVFPNYFLDCRQVSGGRRWDNRITSDSGDWSGNVYDFWKRASRMLCEGLPVPFELDSEMRRIDDTPQHEAVREGLTNALVHADYYGRTGIVAIQKRTTVEFSNPGCLRIPIEVVEGGGVSDPRNRTLMTMFNLLGRGDKAGSGFDLLQSAARYAGVAGPELVEFIEPDRTRLTLHVQMDGTKLRGPGVIDVSSSVISSDSSVVNVVSNVGNERGFGGYPSTDIDSDGAAGGQTDKAGGITQVIGGQTDEVDGLTQEVGGQTGDLGGQTGLKGTFDRRLSVRHELEERNVLRCIAADHKAQARAIAAQIGMSTRQVERTIKRLRESGRLERIGGSRGYWKINE